MTGLDSITDSDLAELVIDDPDTVLERAADAAQLRAALSAASRPRLPRPEPDRRCGRAAVLNRPRRNQQYAAR